MSRLKELFSDSVIYGISSVLARFLNYLLVPFHTDLFRPAQYGVIGLVYAAVAFLNVLFTFGMESAYIRYAEDRKEAPNVFKTLQLALLGFASLLSLLLWLMMPLFLPLLSLTPDTSGIFLLMIGILWFDTLSIVPMAELRLIRKASVFAALRIGHVAVNLGLNFYLLLVLDMGIEAVFVANLIASVVMTLLAWALTSPMLKGIWSPALLQKAFHFGWPFVPAGIGYAINEMLDRFLLSGMDAADAERIYGAGTTPEDLVGIYNACYKLAVFMLLFVQMYRMAWQPFFMRHSRAEDASALFGRAFMAFHAVAAVVFVAVSLFREQIVAIRIPVLEASLIHPSYWAGLDIVPFLLLAYWFHGWYINFSSGIFIKEKTRVLYKITLLGALVTVVANVALIPLFGMTGSAVATLCSYGVMALTLGRISRNVLRVEYRLLRSLGLMLFAAIMVFGADIAGTWFATSEAWEEMIGIWLYAGILILVAGASWVYLRPLRN